MIEIKSIYKQFDGRTVLENISARFNDGETTLIIGQSGAGKTVLLNSIVGLLTPDTGEALYDGKNFFTMSKNEKLKLRRQIGMLFQSSALFDSMNVLENVDVNLDYDLSVRRDYTSHTGTVSLKYNF